MEESWPRRSAGRKWLLGDDAAEDVIRNTVDERAPLLTTDSASSVNFPIVQSEHRGLISWQQETGTLFVYTVPLVLTSLLQNSISATSVFMIGKLGPIELGAVTLANQSALITLMTPFQGFVTSLDTLCAQAYGAGNIHLVGVHCQRMTAFLLLLCVPVIILWINSEAVFMAFLPNPESATLAGLYLRVLAFGAPGFVLFEVGKRFVQAQCIFRATTYVLLIAAPTNIFLQWLLVWKMEMGFIGAPIAAALTLNLLPVLLLLYVLLIDGSKCWGGFSRSAFTNWSLMLKMAIPTMLMLQIEGFAFEALTIFSSQFGTDFLAVQSILMTLTSISYQIPYSLSIVIATRVAHLVGAAEVAAAKRSSKVGLAIILAIALTNITVYLVFRHQIPRLFTDNETILTMTISYMPLVGMIQALDCISEGAHGLLRGVGRQFVGGPANIIAYYGIALPVTLGLCLGLGWKLDGLWTGLAVGLICVSIFEYTYFYYVNWEKAAQEAEVRNTAG